MTNFIRLNRKKDRESAARTVLEATSIWKGAIRDNISPLDIFGFPLHDPPEDYALNAFAYALEDGNITAKSDNNWLVGFIHAVDEIYVWVFIRPLSGEGYGTQDFVTLPWERPGAKD